MSKILVEVYVPAVSRTIDLFVPCEIKFRQVAELIEQLLVSDVNLGGESVKGAVVCSRETGEPIRLDFSASELGMGNGTRLLVI